MSYHRRRARLGAVAAAALLLAGRAAAQAGSTAACAVVADSLRTPAAARLAPGTYVLTVVSTVGPTAGRTERGTLTLVRARPADHSPRTGQRPRADEDRRATPLWGYTDADLRAVGAPLPSGRNLDEPQPDSRDPIYPGVLVHIQNHGSRRHLQQNVLTVGTSVNARAQLDYGVADGPGIVMWVREITPAGFRGTWSEGGLVPTGGYYCAARVAP